MELAQADIIISKLRAFLDGAGICRQWAKSYIMKSLVPCDGKCGLLHQKFSKNCVHGLDCPNQKKGICLFRHLDPKAESFNAASPVSTVEAAQKLCRLVFRDGQDATMTQEGCFVRLKNGKHYIASCSHGAIGAIRPPEVFYGPNLSQSIQLGREAREPDGENHGGVRPGKQDVLLWAVPKEMMNSIKFWEVEEPKEGENIEITFHKGKKIANTRTKASCLTSKVHAISCPQFGSKETKKITFSNLWGHRGTTEPGNSGSAVVKLTNKFCGVHVGSTQSDITNTEELSMFCAYDKEWEEAVAPAKN
jgi:hypothetical protein